MYSRRLAILFCWIGLWQTRLGQEWKKNNFRLYNHTGVAGRVTCGDNISMSEMFLFSEELKLTFFFPWSVTIVCYLSEKNLADSMKILVYLNIEQFTWILLGRILTNELKFLFFFLKVIVKCFELHSLTCLVSKSTCFCVNI